MEDVLVPLFFFASVFAFPLLRREMIHRHRLAYLRQQAVAGAAPAAPGDPAGVPASGVAAGGSAAELALRLPEPHRLYALALLCRLQDALGERAGDLDAHSRFLVTQARHDYLPATLRAYLELTPAARARLGEGGQSAETLLRGQLERIGEGVAGALRLDHIAADRLLTQGHFLNERFGQDGRRARA